MGSYRQKSALRAGVWREQHSDKGKHKNSWEMRSPAPAAFNIQHDRETSWEWLDQLLLQEELWKMRISAWVILTFTRLLCRNFLLNYDNCISALGKGCFLRASSLVLVNKYNPSRLKWCHWCALEASLPECASPRLCTTTQSKCSLRYFKGDVCAS